jgi:hypothetical protein
VLAAVAGVALSAVAVAAAEKQIRFTKAGQVAARATVLQQADLVLPGWTGGAKKPDLTSDAGCANFHPKDSDLVLNGAAETDWKRAGLEFDSEAEVMQTARMVRLDWQRTVLSSNMLPCLRKLLAKTVGSAASASIRTVAFPRVSTFTHAFRILIAVKSGTQTVHVITDLVLFGRGRTELSLTTTAPAAAAASVHGAEVRLARLMASRIRA